MTAAKTPRAKKVVAVKSEDAPQYNVVREMTDDEILARAEIIARNRLQGLEAMVSPAVTRRYVNAMVGNRPHEVFGVMYLNSQHQVIGTEEIFRGTIDGANVYPREVVKAALLKNAAAVIFYHNHPSGTVEPSLADRQITRRLVDALSLVDIRVLDHVICGGAETVSFVERGLI